MREKLLLLPSGNRRSLSPERIAQLRLAALCVGVLMVAIGALNLAARAAGMFRLSSADAALALAPAIGAEDPSALAAASSTAGMVPARLRIPSIGVDAAVEQVSVKADGTMDTPKKFGDVAWYSPGSKPGSAAGHAVIDGHVDNALTTAGVFEHLGEVSAGDYVTVADASGKTVVYKVASITSYPVDQAPAADIFSTTGSSELVLITCTGDWVPGERQFDQRLVVIATPAQ